MLVRAVVFLTLLAGSGAAQAPTATVGGVLRDSLAGGTVAGAVVQLVAATVPGSPARSTTSDSAGRYILRDIPDGHYTLGFFHPLLDSLGVEAPLRPAIVERQRSVRADLAIPSAARLRQAICGAANASESGGVVVGTVREALTGHPVGGATVTGEWLELAFTAEGVVRRLPSLTVTTADNGRFALCNVPGAGTMALVVNHGANSTDMIEVVVPEVAFVRQELYVGAPKGGAGRVSGTVLTAVGGRPVGGARVSVVNGIETRADERGQWTLVDVPLGTRVLEIRAVGYHPDRRAIAIVPGASAVRTTLVTTGAMLDTVRIRASRIQGRDLTEFYERRRSGVGRYFTADDIARLDPSTTTEALGAMPGLRVERPALGDPYINMRSLEGGRCTPAVYLDGMYFGGIGPDQIDGWVPPDAVGGIEVYSATTVPPQYQRDALSPCGSIVLWTQPSKRWMSTMSMKKRLATLGGIAAGAFLIGALIPK